ncbi:MAG: class I SAM-dependent RNA methyltransferase [Pseudomonadota bacterium]
MTTSMSVEAEILSLGAQGDGVTADGVFVPFALPGERVRISPIGHRATIERQLSEAAERQPAPCAHFGQCGGCVLQHASDALVADWKHDLVARALAARGFDDVEIRPIVTVPEGSRRRVTLTGRRSKKGAVVGFHAAGSDQIVPISDCAVAVPEILSIRPKLEELVTTGASRKGEVRLTVTVSDSGLDVAVTGGKPVEGPMYGQLVAVAATSDMARLCWNDEDVVTRRPPEQTIGRARVVPPPGGFLQPTREGAEALTEAMREAIGPAKSIADLFAGSGTFSLPLAEQADVWAVEGEAGAIAALDAGWRMAEGLRRVRTEVRDLFHRPLLARECEKLEAVVFDPPRQGARAQVEQLALSEIPRIGTVSCNPATFARDARILVEGGYRLDWVLPIDQFRWSHHVELAAQFSRA